MTAQISLWTAIQNCRHTAQRIVWKLPDGAHLDLTGAAIVGYKRSLATGIVTAIDGAFAVTNAAGGAFEWAFGANDVATVANYEVQFIATFPGGTKEATYPVPWVVSEILGAGGVTPPAPVGAPSLVFSNPDNSIFLATIL